MRELGYAQPLESPLPHIQSVAVLIPDITNPFYFDFIRGSQNRLRDSGYTQVLIEDSIEVESTFLDLMHSAVAPSWSRHGSTTTASSSSPSSSKT